MKEMNDIDEKRVCVLTSEVGQHRGEGNGEEDEGDADALPRAPVLTSLVDVEARG